MKPRRLPTQLVLIFSIVIAACSTETQVGPRLTDVTIPDAIAASLTVAVEANRTDLSANGQDRAQVKATVLDGAGRPVVDQSIFFTLATRAYDDDPGTLSVESGATDEEGKLLTLYTSPELSYVPADSAAVITASIADPEVEFSPSASVAILLAPKGAPPEPDDGSSGSGEAKTPVVTTFIPDSAPVDDPITVIVLGTDFDSGSVVTFISSKINPPAIVVPNAAMPGQLIITTPVLKADQAGETDFFVTTSAGLVSETKKFTFTTD